MSDLSVEKLELFINDVLKEDLKQLEQYIMKYNEEIMEYIQLKNTVQTLKENLDDGFKTQMHIGANIFMEGKVDNMEKMLVDIGKGCFLEMTLDEAIKFCDSKTKLLTKYCDVVREASIKKRADLKLALMCIGEQEKLHVQEKD